MEKMGDKAAVFVLLGQSNAVGHGLPMKDEDKICVPLKNVFGLSRTSNQSYDNDTLYWSGYTSGGMNLAEEQDDTYSVANCLARLWQDEIDSGNSDLPDLYIVHIAIGAQGVTGDYMWNPCRYDKKIVPGKLGKVDISLYPFTVHILSKVKDSVSKLGKVPEIMGIHWRGGENDTVADGKLLEATLKDNYNKIFNGFFDALGEKAPVVLHKIVCHERCTDLDPSGESLKKMHYINGIFEELCEESGCITMFDVTECPQYIPDVRGNGIFMKDAVHFTPEVNRWVAGRILEQYKNL